MKSSLLLNIMATVAHATIQGFSISRNQQSVNFTEAHSMGLKFVYIKATEGTTYTDPKFSSHWADAASMYRGGHHLARPTTSSGSTQARYFLSHGGGWMNDSQTLPGLLELPSECSDTKPAELVEWITEFTREYNEATGRFPVLFTSNAWWVECTGNSHKFNKDHLLMLKSWIDTVGMIPGGWDYWSFWQYKDSSAWGGESDVFHKEEEDLKKLTEI